MSKEIDFGVLDECFMEFYRQQIERRKMNFETEDEGDDEEDIDEDGDEEEEEEEEEEENADEVRIKFNKITKYVSFILIVGI